MNKKIYILLFSIVLAGLVLSCIDESKFPLPYNSRTVAAYLRMYRVASNIFDLNDMANSGFDCTFEPVDEANGANTANIEFYVSWRGSIGLSKEVPVKTVDASVFAAVPAPTYSVYKRATIRVTATEMLAALNLPLNGATLDPDTPGACAGCTPATGLVAFPGTFATGDQLVVRWTQVLKDGRRYTVNNPQVNVNPAFVNNVGGVPEDNATANITGGQFYSSPYTFTLTARTQAAGQVMYTGAYTLQQRANWSPSHSVALHQTSYPKYMNVVSFPTQVVNVSVPVGGLSSERQFTVTYRGATATMTLNLEPNTAGAGLTGTAGAAALTTLIGMGFPATTTNNNLGTININLQNTGQNCTSKRQFYWVTPQTGTFAGSTLLPLGAPQSTYPNRGLYRQDLPGTVAGEAWSISVDDDCDEYGRRQGYCTWTRRIYLSLTR